MSYIFIVGVYKHAWNSWTVDCHKVNKVVFIFISNNGLSVSKTVSSNWHTFYLTH